MTRGPRTTSGRRFRRLATAGGVALSALVIWCVGAFAAPGDLDHSFGKNGKVAVNFGGSDGVGYTLSHDIAVDSKNRVVQIGDTDAQGPIEYAIARLNPDGSPDDSFSGDGRQTVDVGPKAQAFAVAMQPDDKILVGGGGGTFRQFTIIRLNANGSVDDSFGVNGIASITFGTRNSAVTDMAIQPNGKIVAVGKASGTEHGYRHTDFGIARFNSDGSPDTSFSGDGEQTVDFNGIDYANAVAIDSHGRIVVAGQGGGNRMIATRLLPNGAIDKHFGSKGRVEIGYPGKDNSSGAEQLAVQADGKLVLAGFTADGRDQRNPFDFAIARLKPDGSLDRSFNKDGRQTVGFGGSDEGHGLALQKDGRIVVGGFTDLRDLAITRLKANGSLDKSFADKGKRTIDFGGQESGGGVALTRSGGILIAGGTSNGYNFVVARLHDR